MAILPLSEWLGAYDRPLVVAGPCSAESEKQVLETARSLAGTGLVRVFRAGVWKPRTRPGFFEGHGEKALEWIARAGRETGLPTTVEVATAWHVELCLRYGIDMVWIGARTSVNPFSIQEIAAVLKGTSLGVLVKNPVNPDINLWTGVIERVAAAGIDKLMAVHRGFNVLESKIFRNVPLWEIPIELKRRIPELPLLCDPSHIGGKPDLLRQVAQHAIDLDMDGLMIESHNDPVHALTDAQQQITPDQLRELIGSLTIRSSASVPGDPMEQLQQLRQKIDQTDHQILELLARRMELAGEIGTYKKNHGMTILQIKRWRNILQDRMDKAQALGLDAGFLKELLELVHNEAIRIQNEVMNHKEENE